MNKTLHFIFVLFLFSCRTEDELEKIENSHIKLFNNEIVKADTLFLLKDVNRNGIELRYLPDSSNYDLTAYQFLFKPNHHLIFYDDTVSNWKTDTLNIDGLIAPITVFDYDIEGSVDEESLIFVYDDRVILIYNYSWIVAERFDFDEKTKRVNDYIIDNRRTLRNRYK